MWNNYTVEMLNPDKIATRQAEADAQRLGDQGRERGEHTFWATRGVERVLVSGTTGAARLRASAAVRASDLRAGVVARERAVRREAGVVAAWMRHVHRPHITVGHHRV